MPDVFFVVNFAKIIIAQVSVIANTPFQADKDTFKKQFLADTDFFVDYIINVRNSLQTSYEY